MSNKDNISIPVVGITDVDGFEKQNLLNHKDSDIESISIIDENSTSSSVSYVKEKLPKRILDILNKIDALIGFYINPVYPKSLIQIITHALAGGVRAGLLTHLIIVGFELARQKSRKPLPNNSYQKLFFGWNQTIMGRSLFVFAFTWKLLYWSLEYIARLRDSGYGKLQSFIPSPRNSPMLQAAKNGFSISMQKLNMARKTSLKYLTKGISSSELEVIDDRARDEISKEVIIINEEKTEDPGDPLNDFVLDNPMIEIKDDNNSSNMQSFFINVRERLVHTVPIGSITQSIQKTSIWRLVWPTLPPRTEIPKPSRSHAFIAGSMAGFLAIIVHPKKSRAPLIEHLSVRALQALLNGGKCARFISRFIQNENGPFGLGWGTPLFALGSMFVMYGYVMEPSSLPKDYFNWMVKAANVSKNSLFLVRRSVRLRENNKYVNKELISSTISKVPMTDYNQFKVWNRYYTKKGKLDTIPCAFFHPKHDHCMQYYVEELIPHIIRMCGPVYAALNVVPALVLKPKQIIKSPIKFIKRSTASIIRSTIFICLYILIYQSIICAHRKQSFIVGDHKSLYMIAGALCAMPIVLEPDRRRLELALYVLPKAFGVFIGSIRRKGLNIPYVPQIQVGLISLSMGILMNFYHTDQSRISGLLVAIMTKIIGTH